MGYTLGIDLGTTYSAAAVCENGRVEIFQLGTRIAAIPSVVAVTEDGSVLTGEAAARRAEQDPARAAREFKRRLGDPAPLLLGGTPYGAEALMGHLLAAIVASVTERRGDSPVAVAVTHPANWGRYKLDLLTEAARVGGVVDAHLLPEPEAAAVAYTQEARVDVGAIYAVYDFGGGTFDAAVLRKTESGWEPFGIPEGMDRFGGIDLDAAVLGHVAGVVGDELEQLDRSDPATQRLLLRLRAECRDCKEALSGDTEAVVTAVLPSGPREVRLTRTEFETMIRPRIEETLGVLRRAIQSAGLEPDELSGVLLVGGSSRIPLVADMIRRETGLDVAVDTHPKHAVAMGAALVAGATPADGSGVDETMAWEDLQQALRDARGD